MSYFPVNLTYQITSNLLGAVLGLAIFKLSVAVVGSGKYTSFASIFYLVNLIVLIVFSTNNALSAKISASKESRYTAWARSFPLQVRFALIACAPLLAIQIFTSLHLTIIEGSAVGLIAFIAQIGGEMAAYSQASATANGLTQRTAIVAIVATFVRFITVLLSIFLIGITAVAVGNLTASVVRLKLNQLSFGNANILKIKLLSPLTVREVRKIKNNILHGLPFLFVRQNPLFFLPVWTWVGEQKSGFSNTNCYLLLPVVGIIIVISQSVTTYFEGKALEDRTFKFSSALISMGAISTIALLFSVLFFNVGISKLLRIQNADPHLSWAVGILLALEFLSWVWIKFYKQGKTKIYAKYLFLYQLIVTIIGIYVPIELYSYVLAAYTGGRALTALLPKLCWKHSNAIKYF